MNTSTANVKALESKIIEIMTISATDYNRRDIWNVIRFIKTMPAIADLYEKVDFDEIHILVDNLT